ncbi:MAG: hypothetical protein AAGL96_12830 [Pseudomonadota bacterium]
MIRTIATSVCVVAACMAQAQTICDAAAAQFNIQFTTFSPLSAATGNLPDGAGVIAHTIHGPYPGQGPTPPGYLDFDALEALTPDLTKTCGDYLAQGTFLPWCGSNHDPLTGALSDSSSWTYVRQDTRIHGAMPGVNDEVVCSSDFNKRYGLIFANAYMNTGDNLGCMYPLDGDTGPRKGKGCGISTHAWAQPPQAQGTCPVSDDATTYEKDFAALITAQGSRAGSLICSLAKSQFDTWVAVRKAVDLGATTWPVNEFVLWNWDSYSTQDIADIGFLAGIYYLSGCERTPVDGDRATAERIAQLFSDWTGVAVPVVELSNAAIRQASDQPFSCN